MQAYFLFPTNVFFIKNDDKIIQLFFLKTGAYIYAQILVDNNICHI